MGLDDTSCRMLLPDDAAGDSGRRQEPAAGGEGGRSAGQGAQQPAGQDVGLFGAASGALQHLRLPRLAASRRPGRFLPEQPLQGARGLLLGQPQRRARKRRTLGVRGLLGACAPQGRRGDDVPAGARVAAGHDSALYDIEPRAKELTWQDRQALRERESTIILDAIRQWLDSEPLGAVLPKSDFAEALRYLRNHWAALNVYVSDGRMPIDNNAVEQLMKQVAMGRKAWLFVCSVAGGEQSAKMMTLVSSCPAA